MDLDKPRLVGCQPSFKIESYELAIAHYIDWLGFELDWQWQAETDAPMIISVTRDDLSLFLSQEATASANTWLRVNVHNLTGLADEWNRRKPQSISVVLEPPFDLPTAYVADPFGNGIALQQIQSAEALAAQQEKLKEIVSYLADQTSVMAASAEPQSLAVMFNCSLGIASEALMVFKRGS